MRSDLQRKSIPLRLVLLNLSVLAMGLCCGGYGASAFAGLIFSNTHHYGFGGKADAVQIVVDVFDNGSSYLWQYTVTNNSFDPNPGVSNGFSGFETALPLAVPDLGNVTSPGPKWETDCCSGQPVEWDIRNEDGNGIMPGETGVFSFTSLPRFRTNSDGWFHSWENNGQTNVTFYADAAADGLGPEVPDVLRPAIPEPSAVAFLLPMLFATLVFWRRSR